jgi:hypothetical protein
MQCSEFDSVPFRGKFYTWKTYRGGEWGVPEAVGTVEGSCGSIQQQLGVYSIMGSAWGPCPRKQCPEYGSMVPCLDTGDPPRPLPNLPMVLGLGSCPALPLPGSKQGVPGWSGLGSDGAVPPRGREGLLADMPSRRLQLLHREGRSCGGWDALPPRYCGHLCQRRVQGGGDSWGDGEGMGSRVWEGT